MLWFCSDNGPSERNAGGLRGGKGTLWENGVRVPGLLEWPRRITRGRRTDAVAGTLDIVPTLTDLLDIRLDSGRTIDGVSLLPVIAGTADSRSSPMPFDIREQRTAEQRHAALIDGRWKLHQYDNRTELYDLQEDPGEAHDVAGGQRAVTRRMTGQLTAWTRSVDAELSATL
jgi:arylsulfatase A-like enzyme